VDLIWHIDIFLFLISGLILGLYYLFYLLPLNRQAKALDPVDHWPAVSLIIAYKDEEENLKYHFDHWLAQDYPNLELILVDDHSEDHGPGFLKFREQDGVKLISLKAKKGKKAAIQAGIQAASHSILLFTDADCKPMGRSWVKQMVKPLLKRKQISVGYSGFYPKLSLLNLIQRYENCMNAVQNSAMIAKGRAYMAVGRNLAYRKELLKAAFFDQTGTILSGDDDLLVNQLSVEFNTVFVEKLESQTISKAADSWKSYFHQRRRQLEAGKFYKANDRLKLALLGISQLLFNLLFIKHLVFREYLSIILSIFVVKLILQLWVSFKPIKRLGEVDLWWQLPILEFIYLPIISVIGVSQYLYKVDRWK